MKKIKKINKTSYGFLLIMLAGLLFTRCSSDHDDAGPDIITPENALSSYIENSDTTLHWEVQKSYKILDVSAYELLLTSQQWRETTWKHQLTVFIPPEIRHEGALLWITGGSLRDGLPKWTSENDEETWALGILAESRQAVVAIIRQVPNQPLFGGLKEDALISYTLQNFKDDGDFSWPLLFPMVKSTVRAMDAIQEFTRETANMEISGFLLSGASKRGWTTWLTGAGDNRVKAIAPAVIDVLNMPVNLDYQVEAWGAYSVEIQDYVDLGIPQAVHTGQGNDITVMVDPYSYRDRLTMPKMILNGTNDPYWPVDAVKHYFDDLPGEKFLHYTPNAGHDLNGGQQALRCISEFFNYTFSDKTYPECSWNATESGSGVNLSISGTTNAVKGASLWTASSTDRDFRDETWTPADLDVTDNSVVNTTIQYPATGYRAFYIELEYAGTQLNDYKICTRVFTTDNEKLL